MDKVKKKKVNCRFAENPEPIKALIRELEISVKSVKVARGSWGDLRAATRWRGRRWHGGSSKNITPGTVLRR